VATYLSTCDWQTQIKVYQQLYRNRRDTMVSALAEMLPQGSWTSPDGGFYVWVKLPGGVDARALLAQAYVQKVAYVPGTAFFADGRGGSHVRLSYCYPPPERIREGVRRFAAAVNAELGAHPARELAGSRR